MEPFEEEGLSTKVEKIDLAIKNVSQILPARQSIRET
jgi:hypothetical protein